MESSIINVSKLFFFNDQDLAVWGYLLEREQTYINVRTRAYIIKKFHSTSIPRQIFFVGQDCFVPRSDVATCGNVTRCNGSALRLRGNVTRFNDS
jgi:hypothetical protein